MIFDDITYSMEGMDWILSLGIIIGLSLLMTMMSSEKFQLDLFFIYMMIFNCFIVSVGIFPIWTEILFIIIVVAFTYINNSTSGGI